MSLTPPYYNQASYQPTSPPIFNDNFNEKSPLSMHQQPPPSSIHRPLESTNCCVRFFLTTRLLIILMVTIVIICIGITMLSLTKNIYPGKWTKTTCTVPSPSFVQEPATFYNPCKHGFTCNLCKIANTMLTFQDPFDTTQNFEQLIIGRDTLESACLEVNQSRSFKCIYQTRQTSSKATTNSNFLTNIFLSLFSPSSALNSSSNSPSQRNNTVPFQSQLDTNPTSQNTPIIDASNSNIFHYSNFDLELYPYDHYKIDRDTYIGQKAAAFGVIGLGLFSLVIYFILVSMRYLVQTYYACRFCSFRFCFTWCIFTFIFPNDKKRIAQRGETELLWEGIRSNNVVVVLDESSRHLRQGECNISTSSDESDSDTPEKILGENKMKIPRPAQPNPTLLPHGLQQYPIGSVGLSVNGQHGPLCMSGLHQSGGANFHTGTIPMSLHLSQNNNNNNMLFSPQPGQSYLGGQSYINSSNFPSRSNNGSPALHSANPSSYQPSNMNL